MVNPKHLAILQDALDKNDITIWNKWRKHNRHILVNLQSASLPNSNLEAANLSEARLEEANLEGANLKNAELWRSNLESANLKNANLTQARLMKSNLRSADFRGATLSEADLIEADLHHAHLIGANLFNAALRGANLHGAYLGESDVYEDYLHQLDSNLIELRETYHTIGSDFRFAYLEDADLSHAYLFGVDLSHANLRHANLDRAYLFQCNFLNAHFLSTKLSDVDLSLVKNLDTVKVEGPCSIGIDTLYKSQSLLKEDWFLEFLRNCGVPDAIITYARLLVVKPIDYYSCFISYSSANEDFAKLLYDTLRGQNIRVWYAPEQILPGHNIKQEIIRGIEHWDKVILCCSESSLTEKWWVDFERTLAETKAQNLQRQYKQAIPVIIPLDLDGYVHNGYKKHTDYDPFLSSYHIADFTDWKNHDSFKLEVDRLIRALQTDDEREDPPPNKMIPRA